MMGEEKTIRAGVLGWPVVHSLSPRLHGFWLAELGIDGAYEAIAVEPDAFPQTLRDLAAQGYAGFNVTLPHKEAALAAVDAADENATRVGAVNTIVNRQGRLVGSNTDGYGFVENLRAGLADLGMEFDCSRGPAAVLGAGGAARAIVAALDDAGAPEIRIVNRTTARAESLAADIARAGGAPIGILDWRMRAAALDGVALVVNATKLGMTGEDPLDLDLDRLADDAVVTDIVYAPLMTPLLKAARSRGNPAVDGLGMLLYQARPGFEAWFGRAPEVSEALRAHVLAGLVGGSGGAGPEGQS